MNDPRRHLGGFEQSRGERQQQGTPGVIGVTPQPGNIPIGPAPPHIRQVLSVYDSRPIGGYDFVLTGSFQPYVDPARALVVSAPGYVTIVRRIEVFAEPSFLNGRVPVWNFSANGVAATAWQWTTPALVTEEGVDTFFVIPPNVAFGLTSATTFVPGAVLYVRYIGNLLLDSNEPPSEQVGQLPHSVFPLTKVI